MRERHFRGLSRQTSVFGIGSEFTPAIIGLTSALAGGFAADDLTALELRSIGESTPPLLNGTAANSNSATGSVASAIL